jgi:hypothetical protein
MVADTFDPILGFLIMGVGNDNNSGVPTPAIQSSRRLLGASLAPTRSLVRAVPSSFRKPSACRATRRYRSHPASRRNAVRRFDGQGSEHLQDLGVLESDQRCFQRALGIVFALSAQTDPGHKRAITTLDAIRVAIRGRLSAAGDKAVLRVGEAYLDELLSELSGNLGLLRPDS